MQKKFPSMGEVFFALCKAVDSPFSLGAWLLWKYDQKSLASLDINPSEYDDPEAFKADYLVCSFLSKFKGLSTGVDLEAEALSRFASAEQACKETNMRLIAARREGQNPFIGSVLFSAKKRIAQLLGPYSIFKVWDSYGWGPGATSSIPRRKALIDLKISQTPISVTRAALPYLYGEIASDLHWSAVLLGVAPTDILGRFSFVKGIFSIREECIVDTVPKNAKTHRVIAKENTGNGFLQKGFGAYFRSRLQRAGIDLDDQSQNQTAAKAAYDESLATLDLKAASDTIAKELVFELLPLDWAFALDDLRSHYAILPDGRRELLHKFSSMGNGFTFELESLIFWAIASSVSEIISRGERVWVYGDDLICPRSCARELVEVLSFCGFTVNSEKSFIEGNFFESCGKHFFKGVEVTPIYQKEQVESYEELIRLGNRLLRCAHRFGGYDSLDERLRPAWRCVWRFAGPSAIFQLPLGTEGDDGWLVTAEDFATTSQDVNLGLRCRVIAPTRKRLPAHEGALLAWTLRRGVTTSSPFMGDVTSSPDTTRSRPLIKSGRWVMPTAEFGLSW